MRTAFGFEIGDATLDRKITLTYIGFRDKKEMGKPFVVQLPDSDVITQPMAVFYGVGKEDSIMVDRLSRNKDGKVILDSNGAVAGGELYDFLGMKAAHNAEMTEDGIPIPPGVTLPLNVHAYYLEQGKLPDGLYAEIDLQIRKLEEIVGKEFGNPDNPLLNSVRGCPRITMPGMMATILNLGITPDIVKGLEKITGNKRFAYDTYRRFIDMFSDTLFWVPHERFEKVFQDVKNTWSIENDLDLTGSHMETIAREYLKLVKDSGNQIPYDPKEQLDLAIKAVFMSAYLPQAVEYMELNNLMGKSGNTITIMPMVYGNIGEDSGTGVSFTRNPNTGENKLFGNFLLNAQGEDVVAGIRTPLPLEKLAELFPDLYKQLILAGKKLEKRYKDMQENEWTIEKRKLYFLQTRTEERTALASLIIATDLYSEKIIDEKELVERVFPNEIDVLLHPVFDPKSEKKVLGKGTGASPGDVSGIIALTPGYAKELYQRGKKVILVRRETSPEDVGGMSASKGILTKIGGPTSHAAVVGRGMNKSVVCGYGDSLEIYEGNNSNRGYILINGVKLTEGEETSTNMLSLCGSTGEVIKGEVPTIESIIAQTAIGIAKQLIGQNQTEEDRAQIRFAEEHKNSKLYRAFNEYLEICKKHSKLCVRANADTPLDAAVAIEFGAEGIGLARTEHMFFQGSKTDAIRKFIFGYTEQMKTDGLAEMKQYHKEDFKGMFKVMDNFPVTIRLLDPPLEEFTFPDNDAINRFAEQLVTHYGGDRDGVRERISQQMKSLHEINPMLGCRGNRLSVMYPKLIEAQVSGIIEAAYELKKDSYNPIVEIMIPVANCAGEIKYTREEAEKVIEKVKARYEGVNVEYKIGTMIELPGAALTADRIAGEADFFSFGTNDLTQATLGISRDDGGKFISQYTQMFYNHKDPFVTLDVERVGRLMQICVKEGRAVKPGLKIGICGEHGGDPASVEFCHKIGLNYVSCSPYRVAVAIVAAAHANLGIEHTRR